MVVSLASLRSLRGHGKVVAFAELGFDFLRALFRALDFESQQALTGPVFVFAHLEDEAAVGVRGLRFFQLDVFVTAIEVPERGLPDLRT